MVKTLTLSLAPFVDRLGPEIETALRKYSCLPAGCPDQLREAIRYSLLAPGKRLRPMLVLMAAEACGGSLSVAMPAACAVEMIHTYSLIHDDLPAMDDDDLRRGRPTCHKVFGEAMAILAGDGLLSLAFQVLAEGIRPQTVAAASCAALAEASGPCQLVGGQADDVAADHGEPEHAIHDREHLEAIHVRKTGAMIRVSLRLGGLAAGAAPEPLMALDDYGRRLGLAFQVTDDLLDVRSTEESMGKRVRKDAQKGKITFPGLLGVDESAAYAGQLIAEACAALQPLAPQAEGLITLARYVLERNR
ncbi:MAG: polyprenyl synthetase family protein [Thermoguttaceae bacterium]|jgi:geranylgeranyl diphosphate synthase type II